MIITVLLMHKVAYKEHISSIKENADTDKRHSLYRPKKKHKRMRNFVVLPATTQSRLFLVLWPPRVRDSNKVK